MRAPLSYFPSLLGELIWKISPLVISEILEVFVNTLSADDKYPVQDCESLALSIQMHYLRCEKHFLNFLFRLWDLHQILKALKKKDDSHT